MLHLNKKVKSVFSLSPIPYNQYTIKTPLYIETPCMVHA